MVNATPPILLLVEDDSNDVLLLQRAFRKAGVTYQVQVAADGDIAVAYLSGDRQFADRKTHPLPTLILLDLKLPRRNGLEVLQWIRQQPEQIQRIPVVVLTSSNLSDDVNRAYALGATSYIAKPTGNYGELVEAIKNVPMERLRG